MLTELEQMEIVEALRKWAAQAPNTPLIGFLDEGELLTPHEVVSEILLGGPTPRCTANNP